ncbi:MAG: DUF1521 domain-containing protein [Pseudomonadota bacterium]|nr:DUF1521 domain-containing protein [Pseudomonadota bacterium]
MNTIVPAQSFANSIGTNALSNAIAFQVASGILGQFMNPLNAGRLAFAAMPELMALRCFTGCQQGILPGGCVMPPPIGIPAPVEPVQQWTAQTTGAGRAEVDLGDGYSLKFNERSSEIEIFNANTGEHTRIWGDPHVDVDGKRVFDFWGTTTFTLENGTKITINTEPWGRNPNAYVASQVVITKGSNALVVDGISQNQMGDLKMTMSNNGYAVDAAHRDGFVLHENATGSSWRSEHTGEVATQKDLNATRIGREYGPGSTLPSLEEMMPRFGDFLMFGTLMNFAELLADTVESAVEDTLREIQPQPRPFV